MPIKRKGLVKISLFLLVSITLTLSIIITNNIVIIHGEWNDLLVTNQLLSVISLPVTIFYIYLLFRMRTVNVLKWLFFVAIALNAFSFIYNVYYYDPIVYLRYGNDWNNAMYFYVMPYLLFGVFSFLTNEHWSVKAYLVFTLASFTWFAWFRYTMFGSNLTVIMSFETDGRETFYYAIASLINAVLFMFMIDSTNKKLMKQKEFDDSEKEDFSSFMKSKK